MVDIRRTTPEDLDMLTRLLLESYQVLDPAIYEPGRLDAAMPAMSKPNPKLIASGTYYVVEIDGEPAGCGGWTFGAPGTDVLTEGVAHIRHFATHPDHLRKGVARRLIEYCCAEAKQQGAQVMMSQSTLSAEPFYASAGFQRVGSVDVDFGQGISLPAVLMKRALV